MAGRGFLPANFGEIFSTMPSQTGRDTAQPAQPGNASGRHASRTPLWIGAAAPVGFLLGFGWQYPRAARARTLGRYREALRQAGLDSAVAPSPVR